MCGSQSFIKRIIPFALTFVIGLFIASFFVSITPNFKFRRDFRRNEVRQLRYEKLQVEIENQILKQRLEESEKRVLLEAPLPPPPPTIKVVPAPPTAK
jgi:hypothetical protein